MATSTCQKAESSLETQLPNASGIQFRLEPWHGGGGGSGGDSAFSVPFTQFKMGTTGFVPYGTNMYVWLYVWLSTIMSPTHILFWVRIMAWEEGKPPPSSSTIVPVWIGTLWTSKGGSFHEGLVAAIWLQVPAPG